MLIQYLRIALRYLARCRISLEESRKAYKGFDVKCSLFTVAIVVYSKCILLIVTLNQATGDLFILALNHWK